MTLNHILLRKTKYNPRTNRLPTHDQSMVDLTSPWFADYQHMFADDEDVVAGELSECEDDDKEAGVVAGQSRQLSASASARAGARG